MIVGQYLVDSLLQEDHRLIDKQIVIDDIYLIRAVIFRWIGNDAVQAILVTGGTGFTGRDSIIVAGDQVSVVLLSELLR